MIIMTCKKLRLLRELDIIKIRVGTRKYVVDSQAALNDLESNYITTILVDECKTIINRVGQTWDITLLWGPEHKDIQATNSLLARQGSDQHTYH